MRGVRGEQNWIEERERGASHLVKLSLPDIFRHGNDPCFHHNDPEIHGNNPFFHHDHPLKISHMRLKLSMPVTLCDMMMTLVTSE